jgi:hypothetical protein
MRDFDRRESTDDREQNSESDARSQSYHWDVGAPGSYHMSSMRSVGSIGSQGSGDRDRGYQSHAALGYHHFNHGQYGVAPAAAHLMNGETQFPPSMYHPAADAPKSDTATVCSGSVMEDIEVESVASQETGQQQSWSTDSVTGSKHNHHSSPSSVKMVVGLRRTNSAGDRLVDDADRSQELLGAVIPQQRAGMSTEDDPDMQMQSSDNRMGPPLSRALLLHGGYSFPAGSVKSFESKADSDVVAHVDTDDCGGSLYESIDAQSVLSQEEAPELEEAAAAARADTKSPADPSASDCSEKPHPFLCGDSDPQNGRTSPGGTIYRGRGVRRYQGRYMNLPLTRFHQSAVHLRSVDEQQMGDEYDNIPPYYGDHDNWQDRYEGEAWERRSQSSSANRRHFGRKRSRSRSRSRSPDPKMSRQEPTASFQGRQCEGNEGNGYLPHDSPRKHHREGRGRNDFHNERNGHRYGSRRHHHLDVDDPAPRNHEYGYGGMRGGTSNDRDGSRYRYPSNRP